MACGTGKTLTALWIKERLEAGRTLVLLPSLNLVSQTLREWEANSKSGLKWICVCSDVSVAKKTNDADEWITNLSALGVAATNQSKDIETFLQQNPDGVVFSTYHSSHLVEQAQKNCDVPPFDLAIADEAHRCAGKTSLLNAGILSDEKIRASKRLFMTATPRVLSNSVKGQANSCDIQVACMDDSSLFGNVLHQLTFSEAIRKQLLTDYKVIVVGVDDPMVHSFIERNVGISTNGGIRFDAETFANHLALSKAIDDYSLRRLITFHSTVKKAKDFSESHLGIISKYSSSDIDSNNIRTNFVYGEMNVNKRSEKIKQLRDVKDGEVSILSNARCLSEGVDVPTLDGIAFIDPRRSVIDITQALGRAIRKSENKSFGYIILPVYLGNGTDDLSKDILNTRFRDVFQVLLALRSQDDRLSDALDQLRIGMVDGGEVEDSAMNQGVMGNIEFDLPENVQTSFYGAIKTLLVEKSTDDWLINYGLLLNFKNENGHTRVPRTHPIGGFCSHLRNDYKNGNLPQYKIDKLNDIEFEWKLGPGKFDMDEMVSNFAEYVRETGSGKIAVSHPVLGKWSNRIRNEYKKGNLPGDLIQKLDAIGFIWDQRDYEWKEKCNGVANFVRKFGRIPKLSHPEYGNFIDRRRHDYKVGKLSQERIALLESIDGWMWKVR